jgi:DNA uptake protein ComE-like DNA-binding protein
MKLKKLFDPFLLLSKAERNGALVLLLIIGLLFSVRLFIPVLYNGSERKKAEFQVRIHKFEDETVDSNCEQVNYSDTKSRTAYKTGGKPKAEVDEEDNISAPIQVFPFDPNQVSFDDLIKLGFSQVAAKSLINYRSKGGRFKTAGDVGRIYGVDSVFLTSISPSIVIPKEENLREMIEINNSDSATFTKLKGVGPVFAQRICKYRNQLGGFVSVEQLKEVYQFSEETYNQLHQYISLDLTNVKKININFAGIDELKQHPYCKYVNARKIVDYRSKKGFIQSVEHLISDSVVDSITFARLSPYLRIE